MSNRDEACNKLAVANRIVFRRPWCVYAETADGHDLLVTSVIGWDNSQRVIVEVAEHIRRFGAPPDSWRRVGQPTNGVPAT